MISDCSVQNLIENEMNSTLGDVDLMPWFVCFLQCTAVLALFERFLLTDF